MFGRLPWLAFERRIRAFFFFVFFDIVPTRYRQTRLITPLALTPPCSTVRISDPIRIGFSAHIRFAIGVHASRALWLAPRTRVNRGTTRGGRSHCGRSSSRRSSSRRSEHRPHQWRLRPRRNYQSAARRVEQVFDSPPLTLIH